MSQTLIGIIIGGVLSGLGTWLTIGIQHKRWILENKITRLSTKREKLEIAYEKTLINLNEGMKNNDYSSNMMSDIEILFPENVSKTFEELMSKEERSEQELREFYYRIALAMKTSLKNIDDQIDSLIL
ncbi:hypothetical protein [Methylobacter tundripaludum]|uniref:Uncharacterized protein n=1 Tax=Methylobacter tundripaludum (strain ATCC BAA-1195 / DSM 17260 / SV96) TaxID=697282 RepID=G3J0W8_METTV|nr:hypothetical protein [Methylobacter tundripaludum]EGW20840.1 hypothetical protein Mettu_3991 [Methylobacter tundripaludum SV96]